MVGRRGVAPIAALHAAAHRIPVERGGGKAQPLRAAADYRGMHAPDGSLPVAFAAVLLCVSWALWKRQIALAIFVVCGAYALGQTGVYRLPVPVTIDQQFRAARDAVLGKQHELVCDSGGLAGLGNTTTEQDRKSAQERQQRCGDLVPDAPNVDTR
ncbi:MAG: hypothetical protein QM679_08645 [Patulibacter sp.]